MRSSLLDRASDCQCTSCNGPGFDPSICRHSEIWGAADEAVLNIIQRKNEKSHKKYFTKKNCTGSKKARKQIGSRHLVSRRFSNNGAKGTGYFLKLWIRDRIDAQYCIITTMLVYVQKQTYFAKLEIPTGKPSWVDALHSKHWCACAERPVADTYICTQSWYNGPISRTRLLFMTSFAKCQLYHVTIWILLKPENHWQILLMVYGWQGHGEGLTQESHV